MENIDQKRTLPRMVSQGSFRIFFISLLVVSIGSALAWILLGGPSTGIDDADIFFVYAGHVAEGHGFVYNIGGEAVEGFTSLLWTLLCSGVAFLFSHMEGPLLLLNLGIGSITVAACFRRSTSPLLFILLLATAPAWFAWCQITLMETGIWCMLITLLAFAAAEQKSKSFCILLFLFVITRPESMLWGVWMLLIYSWGKSWKAWIRPVNVFAMSVIGLIAFRLWYFGYPVPNTYYAKVSDDLLSNLFSGAAYFGDYLISAPLVLVALLLTGFMLVKGLKSGQSELAFETRVALCLLPGLGIPILVGGDHFGAARFYQPIWPLLCLLAANAWSRRKAYNPRISYGVICVCIVLGWWLFPSTANLKHEFRIAGEGRANGSSMTQMFSDLETWPTVAVITAGGNKLNYDGQVYDLMGLNSTEMAHAPGAQTGIKNHSGFNRDLFYRWQPDILIFGDSVLFDSMVLGGLYDEPQFKSLYTKSTLHQNGASLQAYYRNDFLMDLPTR